MIYRPACCAEPHEELHALIELGYASKDPAMRKAAGIVDTWRSHLSMYLHTMGMCNCKEEASEADHEFLKRTPSERLARSGKAFSNQKD